MTVSRRNLFSWVVGGFGFIGFLLLEGCATGGAVVPAPEPARTVSAQPAVKVAPQQDWSDAVLYFVMVDRFVDGDPNNNSRVDLRGKGTFHGGDFVGLRSALDDLADLGITTIWITPVVKNIPGYVTGAGFPDWGYHGYWADDFYKVDPRFGTESELRRLVEDCHSRGIKVLLDVVYNHVGYDSQYLTNDRTRSWIRTQCGVDDVTSCVAGLPDLRTEAPDVAQYLFGAHLGLAQRVGVDGFRLDTVKHVEHTFWKEHRARIRRDIGSDFFLLGEVWGGDSQSLDPWFSGDEMDAGFDFSFQGSVLGFLTGRGRPVAFERYLETRHKIRPGYRVSHFLSSHDVPGALFQLKGDKELFRLAAVLEFTTLGIPMIYYGEEVGRLGGDWPDNRSDMPWGDQPRKPGHGLARDEALRGFYKKLIAIRRAHPALWRGTHSGLFGEGDLLVFQRIDAATKDVVVVAVNRGGVEAKASIAMPQNWIGQPIVDALNGGTLPAAEADGKLNLAVPARGARILMAGQPN